MIGMVQIEIPALRTLYDRSVTGAFPEIAPFEDRISGILFPVTSQAFGTGHFDPVITTIITASPLQSRNDNNIRSVSVKPVLHRHFPAIPYHDRSV